MTHTHYDFISLSDVYGVSAMMKDGKWGLVNAENPNEEIIAPIFDEEPYFESNCDFWMVKKDGLYGAVGVKGEKIIPIVYEQFYFGLEDKIIAVKDGKSGIIDSKGKEIFPFEYEALDYFSEEIIVAYKQSKAGVVSIENKVIIPFEYDSISCYDSGILRVEKNGLVGCLKLPNQQILECIYERIMLFNEYILVRKGGEEFLFTCDGKSVFESVFSELIPLTENLFIASKGGFSGVINIEGKIIIPFEYKRMVRLSEDYIKVCDESGKWGLFRLDGKQICGTIYEDIYHIGKGLAKVIINNKVGAIDLMGNLVVGCKYDDIETYDMQYGYMRAKRNGKLTLVNGKGEEIIPCIYDRMGPPDEEDVVVEYNDSQGYVIFKRD